MKKPILLSLILLLISNLLVSRLYAKDLAQMQESKECLGMYIYIVKELKKRYPDGAIDIVEPIMASGRYSPCEVVDAAKYLGIDVGIDIDQLKIQYKKFVNNYENAKKMYEEAIRNKP